MSYVALYRKFRPDNFKDVKGQEHIVTTLKNQITADRVGHAYLFCGTRGTGKTTIAKLFAKTVNCENPKDGNPCGECASCKAIAAGASMSVIEIDAASNNGVDNIREIIEEVSFPPADGKYKIYIIDEVHMLSIGAFNALLKTLEEPPSYCIFILATTDPQKVPITILSRCQRYDFKRITVDTITDRLEELTAIENVSVEPRALRYIAKVADGSMRDALSLLDQCIAFHYGETLTFDMALNVLGAVDTVVFSNLFRDIIAGDIIGCITILEDAVMSGRDLTQFVADFIWYLRNMLIVKTTDNPEDILDISSENRSRLEEEAAMCDTDVIMRYIRSISELSNNIRYAASKRIMIEMALMRLCKPQMETDREAIVDRVRVLEDKMEKGVPVTAASMVVTSGAVASPEAPVQVRELPKALPEDIKQIANGWSTIVNNADAMLRVHLKSVYPSLDEANRLKIVCKEKMQKSYIDSEDGRMRLGSLLRECTGKEVEFVVELLPADGSKDGLNPNLLALQNIHTDIVTENIHEEEDYV